jgi:delta 1-pyrroline-5-carboxylate dehydrogenase
MNLLTHNPEQQLSAKAKAFLARPKRLFINGRFVDAVAGETFETEDPALGTAITEVASAKREDVEQAAAAARDAFEKRWSTLAPAQRGAYLFKLADLISENLEELGHLEALDTGKPVKKATGEIGLLLRPTVTMPAGPPNSVAEASTSHSRRIRIIALPCGSPSG